MEILPRLTGIKKYHINYRHVIDTLLRKPGGFRNYRHQADLFPRAVFRQAWDAVQMRLAMNSLLNRAGVVHEGLIGDEDDEEIKVVGITIHRSE